jgi:hypothetical protein
MYAMFSAAPTTGTGTGTTTSTGGGTITNFAGEATTTGNAPSARHVGLVLSGACGAALLMLLL